MRDEGGRRYEKVCACDFPVKRFFRLSNVLSDVGVASASDEQINSEQCRSILLQEADGGGKGGREASRESTDAVPASRGPRQGGVSDIGVRAPGQRPGVQFGQAAGIDDGSEPSGRPVGFPLRPAATPSRADLLKHDDDRRDSRQVNRHLTSPPLPPRLSLCVESGAGSTFCFFLFSNLPYDR